MEFKTAFFFFSCPVAIDRCIDRVLRKTSRLHRITGEIWFSLYVQLCDYQGHKPHHLSRNNWFLCFLILWLWGRSFKSTQFSSSWSKDEFSLERRNAFLISSCITVRQAVLEMFVLIFYFCLKLNYNLISLWITSLIKNHLFLAIPFLQHLTAL